MDILQDLIVYSKSQDHNKTTKKLNMWCLLTSLQFQPYLEGPAGPIVLLQCNQILYNPAQGP